MKKAFTSTLIGASVFLALISVLSKGLGFIREIIYASKFGLSLDFDLFLVASIIPFTINTILYWIGQNYFIPIYHKVENINYNRFKFFNNIQITFLLLSIILSLILLIFSNNIINILAAEVIYDEITLSKPLTIFRILLLTIPLTAFFSIQTALLQAEYLFRYPAFSVVLQNIIIIILLILFADNWGVYIIPYAFIVSIIIQILFLHNIISKTLKFSFLRSIKNYRFRIPSPMLLFLILVSDSIALLYVLADRLFFEQLEAGGISALNYGLTIYVLPITILSYAFATVVFPRFSYLTSIKNNSELKSNLEIINRFYFLIFIPIAIILFYFSDFFVQVMFQRGNFFEEDTIKTSSTISFYALSLVFYAGYTVTNKYFYSAGLIKQLIFVNVLAIFIKFILNYFLVIDMKQDGLALSTSIAYSVLYISTLFYLRYGQNIIRLKPIFTTFIIYFAIAVLSFVLSSVLSDYFTINSILNTIFKIVITLIFYQLIILLINSNESAIIKEIIFKFANK